MMWGELLGIALVASSAALGVAALIVKYPNTFLIVKILGASYLMWVGIQMWLSKGALAINITPSKTQPKAALQLALQGFTTAIANPKSWLFYIALLPPFLNPEQPIFFQLSLLITIILVIEFICLLIYATGGSSLRYVLQKTNNVQLINRVAGSLLMGLSLWLLFL